MQWSATNTTDNRRSSQPRTQPTQLSATNTTNNRRSSQPRTQPTQLSATNTTDNRRSSQPRTQPTQLSATYSPNAAVSHAHNRPDPACAKTEARHNQHGTTSRPDCKRYHCQLLLSIIVVTLSIGLCHTPSTGLRHSSLEEGAGSVLGSDAGSVGLCQTPSTGLRHPSFNFGGRCRKAMLGVWVCVKLQALVYDILPSTLEEGAGKRCWSVGLCQTPSTGLRHPSFNFGGRCRKAMLGVWVCVKLQALVYDILPSTLEEGAGKAMLGVWVCVKLQALVYDILPSTLEEGAGKRCWECGSVSNSKHWFTTSFLQLWRKVPESDAGSVGLCMTDVSEAGLVALKQAGARMTVIVPR